MEIKIILKKSLKDIKMLQINFIMIYIIYKISVLLKITRISLTFIFTFFFQFLEHIMIKISSLQEDKDIEKNIIKDVINWKKIKQETNDAGIKGMRNLFRLKKENEAIKHRILRYIGHIFEHEERLYY